MTAAALAEGSCSVGAGADRITYPHCFNIVMDAGLLAEFSGVLAGLTFTAVAVLAGRFGGREDASEHGRQPSVEDTLILFLSAFVSFTIATYLFTSAAGEVHPEGRAAFIAFCASLALSIALEQLLVGLVRLVDHLGFERAARFTAFTYSHAVLPVIFVYMALTAVDLSGLRLSAAEAWSTPLAYGCIALCACLVLWTLRPGPRAGESHRGHESSVMLPAVSSSLAVVVAAIAAAVWAEQDYTAAAPEEAFMTFIVVLFLVTLLHHHRVQGYFSVNQLAMDWIRRRAGRVRAEPTPARRSPVGPASDDDRKR
jgi:hypothetical protein